MPMYDRLCVAGHEMLDCWEPVEAPEVPCKECGKETERAFIGKPAAVAADEIPGGIWIRHGLCDAETGAPRKYYSHSEMKAEAAKRGVVSFVEHIGEQGSDKSRHTVRWTAPPVISEEERLRNWYAHESLLQRGKTLPEGNNGSNAGRIERKISSNSKGDLQSD